MVEFKFEDRNFEDTRTLPPQELGDMRFRALLSQTQWHGLPTAVRKRFGSHITGGQSKIYRGHITRNKMSRLGYGLAQILRLIGAPLPIEKDGIGAPAIVTVTEDKYRNGQFWTRQYGREKTFPQVIHSAKRFQGPTGLEEHIGFGLGMTLTLDTVCGAILFKQDKYFWEIFGLRFYLPNWMTPGRLTITHTEIGKEDVDCTHIKSAGFEFDLHLKHKVFGELIHQTAYFHDVAPEP